MQHIAMEDSVSDPWRVLITRAPAQAHELAAGLEQANCQVAYFPLLRIEPMPSAGLLAAREARSYDWIIFTSRNAVESLAGAWYGILQSQHLALLWLVLVRRRRLGNMVGMLIWCHSSKMLMVC